MASKLDKYLRPTVIFDVQNPEHRQHYFNFLDTRTWSACPYQFITGNRDDSPILTVAIEHQLLKYYRDADRSLAKQGRSLIEVAMRVVNEEHV